MTGPDFCFDGQPRIIHRPVVKRTNWRGWDSQTRHVAGNVDEERIFKMGFWMPPWLNRRTRPLFCVTFLLVFWALIAAPRQGVATPRLTQRGLSFAEGGRALTSAEDEGAPIESAIAASRKPPAAEHYGQTWIVVDPFRKDNERVLLTLRVVTGFMVVQYIWCNAPRHEGLTPKCLSFIERMREEMGTTVRGVVVQVRHYELQNLLSTLASDTRIDKIFISCMEKRELSALLSVWRLLRLLPSSDTLWTFCTLHANSNRQFCISELHSSTQCPL